MPYIRDDQFIGPLTRQTSITNRAWLLRRVNPQLPRPEAYEFARDMQAYADEQEWSAYDLLETIALTYIPEEKQHLDTDQSEECSCPF